MTTIAGVVKGNKVILASDSRTSRGWQRIDQDSERSKLFRGTDFICAGTGYAAESQLLELYGKDHSIGEGSVMRVTQYLVEFLNWLKTNHLGKEINNNFIIGHNSGLYTTYGLEVHKVNKATDGSGGLYAYTALHLDHEIESAIEIACELDAFSDTPINTLEIKLNKR